MKIGSDIFFYKKESKYMTKIKICLDAGHYGKYNQSPVVNKYYESDMTWKLHLKLKKYLEERDIEVITTRAKQKTNIGLTARGKAAKGCDLFLSIHSNAATKESVDYPIAFVPIDGSANELG
jgi:N-acetylmuramoyl-L-alanine amidase